MNPDHRVLRFLIAGGINTAFGYAAYGALVLVGLVPHAALILGMISGVLFNFLTTGTVFGSRTARLLPRFLAVYGVQLAANVAFLDLLLRGGIGPLVGQAIAVLLFTPLNFILMRRFVFARSPESPMKTPMKTMAR